MLQNDQEERNIIAMLDYPSLEENEESLLNHPAVVAILLESERIANTVAQKITELRSLVEKHTELSKLFSNKAKPIPKQETKLGGAAIDSTYPPEGGIELIGGRLAGVVAGYIVFGASCKNCRAAYARAFFIDTEDAYNKLQLYSKILEKQVALRVIKLIENGEIKKARLLVFDGELIPYSLVFQPSTRIKRNKLLTKLEELTLSLLKAAKNNSISIIGVVKRSYSRMLSALTGLKLPLNDKAISSLLLREGMYLELGNFKSILSYYASTISGIIERLEERPEYGDVRVIFYKPTIPVAYGQAVKLEVLDYASIGIENIVAVMNSLTNPATGIPYPVDMIDEYVRLESRILELLRRRVTSLLSALGRDTVIILGHTNPEKRYLVEQP